MSSYDAQYHLGWSQGIEEGRQISVQMYQDGLAVNPLPKIVNWNKERRMDTIEPTDCSVVYCKLEELFEFLGINKCFNDERQFKRLVNQYKSYIMDEAYSLGASSTIEEKIDSLNDDTVFNTGFILRYGYDPTKTLNETVLEIDSRTGDFDEVSGKWVKLRTPEAMAKWIQADYSKCLL